jgi:hypothetical protein
MPVMLSLVLLALAAVSPGYAGAVPAPAPKASLDPVVEHWCGELSGMLRSVHRDRCLSRPWRFDAKTQNGHPIPYLYWGKDPATPTVGPGQDGPRRVLVLGAIHGDEISAVSTIFRWIDFLDRTKGDSFLRQHVYLFLPLTNPDGFYAKPRTRTNASSVDLNRNFATKLWDEEAMTFWKRKASSDPRRFPGKTAASEIETQAVQKAVNEFRPDLIISVHAPYRLVDHDGPILFPDMRSPLPVRTLGAYPGSLGTYAGIERNIPVVTPELPDANHLPEGNAIEQLLIFIMKSKF